MEELEKAKQLIAEKEAENQKLFLEKYNELCAEFGYHIEAVVNLQIVKNS